MKKTYSQPIILVTQIESASIVCASRGVSSDLDGNIDISYGGVDEDGELIPAARQYRGDWDEEEEELK